MLFERICFRHLISSSRISKKTFSSVRTIYGEAVRDDLESAPSEPISAMPPPPTSIVSAAHPQQREASFYTLFRNSNYVKLGNLRRSPKPVVGRIVRVIDDDLYIDFGGKFKTVCQRPRTKGYRYRVGTEVAVALHDLEMTSRFLGAIRDTTLLEADATLLELVEERPTDATSPRLDDVVEEAEEVVDVGALLSFTDFNNIFDDPAQIDLTVEKKVINKDSKEDGNEECKEEE